MLRDTHDAQKSVGFYSYQEGQERPKGDFYATPKQAIDGLLSKEIFGETILEPCCGNGAISKILEGHEAVLSNTWIGGKAVPKVTRKYKVISHDLYDWGYGEPGIDFLNSEICSHANPEDI